MRQFEATISVRVADLPKAVDDAGRQRRRELLIHRLSRGARAQQPPIGEVQMAAIRLDLSTIGEPGHVAVSALTEYITYPDPQNDPLNYSQRDDTAPNNAWPNGNGWIEFQIAEGS